jgi:hypothetical protein
MNRSKMTEVQKEHRRAYARIYYRRPEAYRKATIRKHLYKVKLNKLFSLWLKQVKNKPCLDCQQTFPACCMDFDHVRGIKKYTISRMVGMSEELIKNELTKCDLVCSNCHRIRTQKRGIRYGKA